MPGTSSPSPRPSHYPPDQALLSAGVVILGVIMVYEITTKELRAANFVEPITVDAIVINAHVRREGGRQSCQPIFRYELNGQMWTTQLPFSNPQSCYTNGSTVALTVDAANPDRISDAASERYAQQSRFNSLAMATIMLVSGGWLRWRKCQGRR